MIPDADDIGDALAVGSSAIGQGRVQATALQMADTAATIALRGVRPVLTLDLQQEGDRPKGRRVTDACIARTVERMMLAVVREGLGTAAAIEGVCRSRQDGHGRPRTTARCEPDPENPESCPPEQNADPTDTDAWLAAYAPAGRPRVAVGVLLVGSGPAATRRRPPRVPSWSRGCAAAADRTARDLDVEVDRHRAVGGRRVVDLELQRGGSRGSRRGS